jgi:uncharacterized membrane protein YcjF (UPF0283 family)
MRERKGHLRAHFWLEAVVGVASLLVALATIVWHDWAETLFGIDPDDGSGSFEAAVTVGCLAVALFLTAVARAEWRRIAPSPA